MIYYTIAVNTPFNNSILTYSSEEQFNRGDLVEVKVGNRKVIGCVLDQNINAQNENFEIKSIQKKSDYNFRLETKYIEFLEWTCRYYRYPLGMHISDVLPKALKRPRKKEKKIIKNIKKFKLTEEQKKAVKLIEENNNEFKKILIHGVTGSGKTVIYLDLIKKALEKEKSVLLLVPEINLTPQTLKFFEESLSHEVYGYHSSITASSKFELWNELTNENKPVLIVGVRSSIFLPVENLGLIIVDEEHDSSFKQEDRCTYNARDLAIKKASLENIPIVLGSATPSLETYVNSKDREIYIRLENRAISQHMPNINIVDSKSSDKRVDKYWPLTTESLKKIDEKIKNKEQVIIYVNRLGYSSYIQCNSCGHEFYCLNCSIPYKYYKNQNKLKCQYCGIDDKFPEECPSCGNMVMAQKGFGTEKIVEVLKEYNSNYRVQKFDRDEIKTMSQLEKSLADFSNHKADILVGTQMISKGHNFKDVNLVVVLGIDSQLNFPDFRSQERVFQQLVQVSGRSGRYEKKGDVLIQTLNPENEIYKLVKNNDIKNFYAIEEGIRKEFGYPPFKKLCMFTFSCSKYELLIKEMDKVSKKFKELSQMINEVEILGPRPSAIEKRVNKFSWVLLVKANDANGIHNFIDNVEKNIVIDKKIQIKINIDPYSIS